MDRVDLLGAGVAEGLAHAIAGQAGIDLHGTFGTADGILERFLAGTACDVLVLTHAQVARLTARRRVRLDVCADLGEWRPAATVEAEGATTDVALASPPPTGRRATTLYTVTLDANSRSRAAGEFAARLTGRDAAAARARAGFGGTAIRRATAGDTDEARALVFGVLGEYGFTPEPQATDADLMDLEAGFLADGGLFDVAIGDDGRMAACCGMKRLGDARIELRKMYVRRDARGQGLGQRLLDRALAWARARGYPRVELETASRLEEAIALYRKAGFVPRPGKPDTCRCDLAFELELS
jgi:GNAT superfamily N-acetyltransferase